MARQHAAERGADADRDSQQGQLDRRRAVPQLAVRNVIERSGGIRDSYV
jgi:hypothetical protein